MEKLALNETTLIRMLKLFKRLRLIDAEAYKILYGEIGTAELRLNFYACFTYLRFFETDEPRLLKALNEQNIKSIFIFGKRDIMYPPKIGNAFFSKLKKAEVVILDQDHEMIGEEFIAALSGLLL